MPETKERCRKCGATACRESGPSCPLCTICLEDLLSDVPETEKLKQEKHCEDANHGILAGEGGETDVCK